MMSREDVLQAAHDASLMGHPEDAVFAALVLIERHMLRTCMALEAIAAATRTTQDARTAVGHVADTERPPWHISWVVPGIGVSGTLKPPNTKRAGGA